MRIREPAVPIMTPDLLPTRNPTTSPTTTTTSTTAVVLFALAAGTLIPATVHAGDGDRPRITRVTVNGKVAWEQRDGRVTVDALEGRAGDTVVVEGAGFGPDAAVHYSNVTINRAAPVKADLEHHRARFDYLKFRQWADLAVVQEVEPRELLSWTDSRIEFRIPLYATTGDLIVTRQEIIGTRKSLRDGGGELRYDPEYVVRGTTPGQAGPPRPAVVEIDPPVDSRPLRFTVLGQEENIRLGRELFFFWPQYSQVAYALTDARADKLAEGTLTDLDGNPLGAEELGWLAWADTGPYADRPAARGAGAPKRPVGTDGPDAKPVPDAGARRAGRIVRTLGPTAPSEPVTFRGVYRNMLYPVWQRAPEVLPRVDIRSEAGDWIGLVRTEFHNVLDGSIDKAWGVTCAACHTAAVEYPTIRGRVREIVPGLPNFRMDFHRGFQHVRYNATGGKDRRRLVTAIGPGMLDFSSAHEDDGLFNPVVIGSHFGREGLPRLSTGGLEGGIHHRNNMAYIHHGGLGRPTLKQSIALQTYINSTQGELESWRRVGLFNHLEEVAARARAAPAGVPAAVAPAWIPEAPAELREVAAEVARHDRLPDLLTADLTAAGNGFPKLTAAWQEGRRAFRGACAKCHADSLGLHTGRDIVPFTRIGSHLPPSDRMLKTEGVRVAPLSHLHHKQTVGYLHDGHVRSLDALLDPARGQAGSPLHQAHYAVGPQSRRVRADTPEQVAAVEQVGVFRPDPADATGKTWVYDYDLHRGRFGLREYGRKVDLPPVPHPFYIEDPATRWRVVLYLKSL